MSELLPRVGARVIRATTALDRAYTLLDRVRSRLVTRLAGNSVLDAYNDLTYGASRVYDAGQPVFRTELFNWEAEMVARAVPGPPGRILVGGAGGGREAFAIAAQGYAVTAFEPSIVLARSMDEKARSLGADVESLVGRYEQLPQLEPVSGGQAVDLAARAPFDASILGWASYSHLRSRAARVQALRAFARLTRGPVLFSFYLRRPPHPGARPGRLARLADSIGLSGDGDRFTPFIGFYHLSAAEELQSELEDAGLRTTIVSWDDSDGRWPWIAAVRQDAEAGAVSRDVA
jgi:SAM-dependent methyltransferase